jgi:antitoxin HicB
VAIAAFCARVSAAAPSASISSAACVVYCDGLYEEVTARAIKRVIARQLAALMRENHLTKSALARRMKTSRAQLDRLLDPGNESVTLGTLTRAAHAVGRKLRMELV